jgi:hypothetical protein
MVDRYDPALVTGYVIHVVACFSLTPIAILQPTLLITPSTLLVDDLETLWFTS